MTRALVTGGAGLIGSHLTDLLIEEGWQVTVLDSLEPQTHPKGEPAWLNPKAKFLRGSVCNPQDWDLALEGVDYVFHQAAFGGFTDEFSKYFEVNVNGTARLFERLAAGRHQVKKVVVASSQAVYAEGAYVDEPGNACYPEVRTEESLMKQQWDPSVKGVKLKPVPTPESKVKRAETPYALSKEFEERISLSHGKQLGLPVTALRYGVTYGPRQSVFNPYTGVVSIFSTMILNGLAPVVYEDGLQTRDFVFVKDIARANFFVMNEHKTDGQALNVGTGRATSVAGLVDKIGQVFGKPTKPQISGEYRVGDVRHIVLDPSKINALGYQAIFSLEQGLQEFFQWIGGQPEVREYFTAAYEKLKKSRLVRQGR